MTKRLSGKTALITGASQGFGAAIAKKLAQEGANVAINYLRNDDMAKAVKNNIEQAGGIAELFRYDATDATQVQALCKDIAEQLGDIDILVLNASGDRPMRTLEELSWEDVLDELNFFVKSPFLLAQSVVPRMKQKKYGRIIQIGSEVFELGVAGYSAYVAAKGAQLGLTRSWAKELGPHQITVNLIAPGFILTERYEDVPDEATKAYIAQVPLKRMGEASDIAEAVTFLASDAANFITGQRLSVNGGLTMQ